MKRLVIFIILFTALYQESKAQCYKIDSLRSVLVVWTKRDTNRVNTLNLLAKEYLKDLRPKNAEYFGQQALVLAESIDHLKGMADAHMILGEAYFTNPLKRDDESIQNYLQGLEIYQKINLKPQEAQALETIGDYYYELSYLKKEYYQRALDYYLQFFALSKQLEDPPTQMRACIVIAQLYAQIGEDKASRKYFLRAVNLKKQVEDDQLDDPHLFSKAERFYQLQIENQKLYNYTLIGGLAVMLVLISLLTILVVQKQRSNRVLTHQKEQIQRQRDDIQVKNRELEFQTEEILAQKDQLALQNQKIREAQDEVEAANENLRTMNHRLEELVQERTQDLVKANQALTVANEELDTVIYRASHDFRGPVTTLVGLSQLAYLQIEPEHVAYELFTKIENTARKMDGMLEKLHQVSYLLGKNMEEQMIELGTIIEEVKVNLKESIENSQMQFRVEVEPATFLYSDRELVLAVLENLIENAIQFRNPEVSITPTVEIQVSNSVATIQLEFKDNGVGIPPEFQDKIFDMFFRGSEVSKGNGLGLYVVRKALERIGAQVEIASEVNQYTSFKIHFPK